MSEPREPPPAGTVERWAWDYVRADSLGHKLAPPPRPRRWEGTTPPRRTAGDRTAGRRIAARRITAPGRPPELRQLRRPPKTPRPGALVDPDRRAQLIHTFLHHELQAAELMCWALLAFPDTPEAFRRGLLRICDDEIRHMGMYADHLARLGHRVGSFGVRDWFWERVPAARRPAELVALLGLGFEGANLDHSERFARLFADVGDEAGARLQRQVGEEEIPHVRFARRWFVQWEGPLTFERWVAALPPPLSPIVMRGRPMQREARRRAGMDADFIEALAGYRPA